MIDFGIPNQERLHSQWQSAESTKKVIVDPPDLLTPDPVAAAVAAQVRVAAAVAKGTGADTAGAGTASLRKVAVMGIHGMGQQLPFETISDLCQVLTATTDLQPHVHLRKTADSEELIGCATLVMPTAPAAAAAPHPAGAGTATAPPGETQVDVYEAYWAPLTEGVVGLGQTVRFLLRSGLNGLCMAWPLAQVGESAGRHESGGARWRQQMWRSFAGLLLTLMVVLWVLALHLQFLELAVAWVVSFWRPWADCAPQVHLLLHGLAHAVPGLVLTAGLACLARMKAGRESKVVPWLSVPVIVLTLLVAEVPFASCWVQTQYALLARGTLAGLTLKLTCPLVGASEWLLQQAWHWLLLGWHWLLAHGGEWLRQHAQDADRGGISALVLLTPVVLGLLWKFLVQFVGDVAVYVSSNQLNVFFETREAIQQTAKDSLRRIYAARTGTGEFEYEAVVLVAHSLGSVIAYDAYNALLNDDLASCDGLSNGALKIPDRTALLLTYGSPLDKVQFLFRAHRTVLHQAMARLQGAQQPMLQRVEYRPQQWVSLWSPWDFFSGRLDFFDTSPVDTTPGRPRPPRSYVHNHEMTELAGDLLAHTHYPRWRRFREFLLRGIGVQ